MSVMGLVERLRRRPGPEAPDDMSVLDLALQQQAPPSYVGEPRVAVLTVARDEAEMLPRWISYYGGQFGVQNLIVIDDNSTDGSTDDLPCTVHRIPGFPPGMFEKTRIRLVSGLAQGLLQTYDVVIFTDTDEFIVPDPAKHDGLLAYLAAKPEPTVHASYALNVIHHVGAEGVLDPALPVLGQRNFAKFARVMCKPSIKRIPAAWRLASHGIAAPYLPDPDLWMFHLKFADLDSLRDRADRRHQGMSNDGRGKKSSWSRSGEEIVGIMEHLFDGVDVDTVRQFSTRRDPHKLVVRAANQRVWRAPKQGQLQALRRSPVVRIPPRFHGLV
jgi:hypothetical protein